MVGVVGSKKWCGLGGSWVLEWWDKGGGGLLEVLGVWYAHNQNICLRVPKE